jgi:dipeptidyl aminopeptidase/acylaminoacyl peptidase
VLVAAVALVIALAGLAFVARTFEGRESPRPTAPAATTNGVIAYGEIGGTQGMFLTVRPDGTDQRVIQVAVPGFVGIPSWSPDGARVAFDVNSFDDPHPESGYFDIYTANADGTDPTRLTFDKVDHSPVWSPDGTRIAYVRGTGAVEQIGVMNADGSDRRQLTDREGLNVAPSWSPDGTKIAFVSWDGSNSDIYVMDADGSNIQRITDDTAHEDQPAWSPDGRLIAFSRIALSSDDSGDDGIFTMAPDGTGIAPLFHVPDPANLGFAWSPDGKEMTVVSITSHRGRTVGVLNLASGILTPITPPGAWFGASWQPLPARSDATVASSGRSAACQYGPWAQLCPQADWVRDFLRQAGIPPSGDTGSAILARQGGQFYVWSTNVDEEGPISKFLPIGSYALVQSVEGTAVYSDGVRFVWQVGDQYVWLQSGEQGFTIEPDLVAALVAASLHTPTS